MRGAADRADLVFRNRAAVSAPDRLDLLAILVFVVSDEETLVLLEERDDSWKFIYLEFLVLRRLGIIMEPLIDGYELTDKLQ